jgi:3-keto-5-aminohexanoate cleavage enzyme
MQAVIRVRLSTPHYGGNLVDGAHLLALFGDVATELCVRADGDEGLFRAYDSVEFLAPVYAGDFIEARGEIVGWGRTSLKMRFTAHKIITPLSGSGGGHAASAAQLLSEPVLCCRASGTCVVPAPLRRAPLSGERIGRPKPCVITAAIVGAETTREQTPYLPITAEEIGAEAARCAAAGASVIHLHVRDDAGNASQSAERFAAAIAAIRRHCGDNAPIIQTSTGGAVGMSIDERCGPLTLSGSVAPEMATLNVGTINFGDDIFVNRRQDTQQVAERIARAGLCPEVEIYDLGHLDIARELVDKGLLKLPLHVQFVLGVRGALSASRRNLELLVDRLADFPGSSWGVAGVGRHQLPMAELAAALGGNIRVGLEDNIYLEKGVLAQGSAPLVARAAEVCQAAGRAVATVAEARALLQNSH